MDIRNIIDVEKLQELQDQFSLATGLTAFVVDAEGENVTKGSGMTDFCAKQTRSCPEGLERCTGGCKKDGVLTCHAGLMEFSMDITVGEEVVGKVIGGGVFTAEPDEDKYRALAGELGLDGDAYVRAMRKVPVVNEESAAAAANMFAMSVNNFVNLGYISTITEKKLEAFNAEMDKAQTAVREANSKMRDLERNASVEKILAVNASIEAARAGEAGVGFAVVAREIGTLANEADGVYSQVTKLVKEIGAAIEAARKVDL